MQRNSFDKPLTLQQMVDERKKFEAEYSKSFFDLPKYDEDTHKTVEALYQLAATQSVFLGEQVKSL